MEKLTKKQMSSIVGGEFWFCTYRTEQQSTLEGGDDPIGPSIIVEAGSAIEAADLVHAMTGATQVNCTRN